jgi:hypothetical protein
MFIRDADLTGLVYGYPGYGDCTGVLSLDTNSFKDLARILLAELARIVLLLRNQSSLDATRYKKKARRDDTRLLY